MGSGFIGLSQAQSVKYNGSARWNHSVDAATPGVILFDHSCAPALRAPLALQSFERHLGAQPDDVVRLISAVNLATMIQIALGIQSQVNPTSRTRQGLVVGEISKMAETRPVVQDWAARALMLLQTREDSIGLISEQGYIRSRSAWVLK
jgi:hypothetical protein